MTAPLPPLTVDSLQAFVKDQQEIDAGLDEDCAAVEDMLMRLATPALVGIDEDAAAIIDMQTRLAESIVQGTKKDTQQLLRMARKLLTPIDQGIAEDTTQLTGMLARSPGSIFPAQRSMPPPGGMYPPASQVVSGASPAPGRPTVPPGVPQKVGGSGPAPGSPPRGITGFPPGQLGGAPGIPGLGAAVGGHLPGALAQSPDASSLLAAQQEPDLSVVSGAGSGGKVAIGGAGLGAGVSRGQPGPGATASPPSAGETIPAPANGVLHAPAPTYRGSPFAPPSPSGKPLPPAMPVPPPVPTAPAEQPADILSAVMYCCSQLSAQLHAVAQALYQLRPDVRQAQAGMLPDSILPDDPLIGEWDDPPEQALTAPDIGPVWEPSRKA